MYYYVNKNLNKIIFEKDTCIEIEPTDSIDNLTNKSFSFSIWANPNEEDYEQFIITRPPIGLGITYTQNNNFKFTLWGSNTAYVIENYRIPNEWYHLSMTYDKDTKEFTVYINGSFIDSKKISKLEDFSGEWFYIAANSENEKTFTGGISDITFWNVSLSQDDIRVLYLKNVEDLNYNPVLWYKCSKGYGNFILDETPNENNGLFKTPSKTDSINFYNLPFGSTERMAMIGDKTKKVGVKFIKHNEEKIKLGYPIKIPNRRFGEYKSLNDNGELTYRESILKNLESFDPDILLNSDIFFDEVRLNLLDMNTIGLSNEDFQIGSRKEYETNHEWLEIIT